MTAQQMISALEDAVSRNGKDLPLIFELTAAHNPGDKIGAVSSITYSGPVVREAPGDALVEAEAVVNILLP